MRQVESQSSKIMSVRHDAALIHFLSTLPQSRMTARRQSPRWGRARSRRRRQRLRKSALGSQAGTGQTLEKSSKFSSLHLIYNKSSIQILHKSLLFLQQGPRRGRGGWSWGVNRKTARDPKVPCEGEREACQESRQVSRQVSEDEGQGSGKGPGKGEEWSG